jgi:hypothetical protein
MVYGPRGLPEVSTVGPGMDRVLQIVSTDPRGFTGSVWLGARYMALDTFEPGVVI